VAARGFPSQVPLLLVCALQMMLDLYDLLIVQVWWRHQRDHLPTSQIVIFELKGPNAGTVELENLFLQGLEHRNWIEKNKMTLKLLFDSGPKGKRINTRKRVRLLLGFYGDKVPPLFYELRDESIRRDHYTEIDFVRLENNNEEVVIISP
jgi:hypothetical protein